MAIAEDDVTARQPVVVVRIGAVFPSIVGGVRLHLVYDQVDAGRATGVRPKCCERLKASGIHLPADMFEGVTEVR